MKQEMPAKRKTILMDIDGTIFYHKDNLYHMVKDVPVLLDGTIERLLEWRVKEYYIVLTTARPEGCRSATEEQLKNIGDLLGAGQPKPGEDTGGGAGADTSIDAVESLKLN